jgi:hypothetical protein
MDYIPGSEAMKLGNIKAKTTKLLRLAVFYSRRQVVAGLRGKLKDASFLHLQLA